MKNIITACIAAMVISLPLSAAEKMTIAVMDFQAQDVAKSEAVKTQFSSCHKIKIPGR